MFSISFEDGEIVVNKRQHYTKLIFPVVPLCFLFLLYKIESKLLEVGVLNKKDLYFIGNDKGSLYEYLTNIWYWDATLFLLTVFSSLFCIYIFWKILRKGSRS